MTTKRTEFTGSREEAIVRARKLLALGSSDNEHEAGLAAAKAQDLMFDYNLRLEDLVNQGLSEVGERATAFNILLTWHARLINAVATTSMCKVLVLTAHRKIGGKVTAKIDRKVILVGRDHDTEISELLIGWLMGELNRLSNEYSESLKGDDLFGDSKSDIQYGATPAQRKRARRSWLEGAAAAVAERLGRSFDDRRAANNESNAMVLHATADIEAYLGTKSLGKGKSMKASNRLDWNSYTKGRLDGESVGLNPTASRR